MPRQPGDKPLMTFDKQRAEREMARAKPGPVIADIKSSVRSLGRRAVDTVRSLTGRRR